MKLAPAFSVMAALGSKCPVISRKEFPFAQLGSVACTALATTCPIYRNFLQVPNRTQSSCPFGHKSASEDSMASAVESVAAAAPSCAHSTLSASSVPASTLDTSLTGGARSLFTDASSRASESLQQSRSDYVSESQAFATLNSVFPAMSAFRSENATDRDAQVFTKYAPDSITSTLIAPEPQVPASYDDMLATSVDKLKQEGRYRVFMDLARVRGKFPRAQRYDSVGQEKEPVTIWCSNDYLGMGQNPVVVEAMHDCIDRVGCGSGGTRNISGTSHYHVELEQELAAFHQKQSSLVFSSAYVANEASLSTIPRLLPNCVIYSDELNHASMIEGMRHSKAPIKIFRHNDVGHLESLLRESDPKVPKLIAFESVYSMDGDVAPVSRFCDLAEKYNALTFMDEAHAVGMYGSHGAGVGESSGQMSRVSIISGTLGKAIGVMGGYIASSSTLIDALRSYAAGFIFTTSIPPVIAAGARASVNYLRHHNMERERLHANAQLFKDLLVDARIPHLPSPTHIVPIIIGDAVKCKAASDLLADKFNIYVQPINYPTVPKGTERFRVTPSPLHTPALMDNFVKGLVHCWENLNLNFAPSHHSGGRS